MLLTYVASILVLVFMILAWVLIQSLWRRVFHENVTDQDVLAGRRSCGNCGCTTVCTVKKSNQK